MDNVLVCQQMSFTIEEQGFANLILLFSVILEPLMASSIELHLVFLVLVLILILLVGHHIAGNLCHDALLK